MGVSYQRKERLYSYDDPGLVAYWKLTELYTIADAEYTIDDFSFNMNSISYSRNSNPSYPSYTYDSSNFLTLCFLRDIANCLSLDYSGLPGVATTARSYIRLPTLSLTEFDRMINGNLIRGNNDMLFYVPQNGNCSN